MPGAQRDDREQVEFIGPTELLVRRQPREARFAGRAEVLDDVIERVRLARAGSYVPGRREGVSSGSSASDDGWMRSKADWGAFW